MKPIVVVGNTVLDVCASIDVTELAAGHHYIAPIELRPGGGMPNVSRALVSIGLEPIQVGAIGSDPAGAALGRLLSTKPQVQPGCPTEVSVIIMQPDRTIINNHAECWIDIASAISAIPIGSVVTLAYMNKCCIRPDEMYEFCNAVRDRRGLLVAGLNGAFSESGRDLILSAGSDQATLVMNAIEAAWLTRSASREMTQIQVLDAAIDRLCMMKGAAIVTLGQYGAVCVAEGQRAACPTRRINGAETLGAGDAFLAGVTAGIASGWDLRQCTAVGNAVAYGVMSHTPLSFSDDDWKSAEIIEFDSVSELFQAEWR